MRPIRVLSTSVGWLPWGGPAFARARAEGKPVLLSIATTWCSASREMDATTYADPGIASLVNEQFVPVRVDADERPDIADRYTLGGIPTTAFLTADGAILGGGTYVSRERMPSALAQVLAAYDAAPDAPASVASVVARAAGAAPAVADVIASTFATFDPQYGGFGEAPKFPLAAPLQLAVDLFVETQDPAFERIAVTSLDAMGWSGLYDVVEGGFFHYAAARDWSDPHTEKLLETNAALIHLYLDAGERLGITRFTERAADALRYVQTWLAEPEDGGWFASQAADAAYYATAERGRAAAPAVSAVQLSDGNAAMAVAALRAARVFDDEGLRAFALRSLERVLLRGYRPGAGAAHVVVGDRVVRGLLVDQAAMVAANLDAFDAGGNVVHEMMAEELAWYAIRTMWDDGLAAFADRAGDEPAVGLMRSRVTPFAVNCDFALALRRLARTSGDGEFDRHASAILDAMAPLALEQGPLAAHYVRAARELSPR
jgi:uncharacterized protein YyaL (SSP411 family)